MNQDNFNPKISVCIPTYEANGKGVEFLTKNIESILSQTYKNLEIIVSDHSKNDEIQNYVTGLKKDNVKYLRYSENIGWPAHNTNNAIKHSTGDYIKLMNLDDFIQGEDSIQLMVDLLSNGSKWVISGCIHYNYETGDWTNPIIPRIEDDGKHLIKGINYVGCPSVGLIPRDEFLDPEVLYMIDCELWYRIFLKYGYPGVLKDHRIVIGIGDHTLTSQLVSKHSEWLTKDIEYCNKKFLI
jgi:glycosyltransferase involved in cell wall biosynthesis